MLSLAIILFVGVSFAFLYLCYKYEKKTHLYVLRNCRETRANWGMFAFKTKVEAKRKQLKNNSKF